MRSLCFGSVVWGLLLCSSGRTAEPARKEKEKPAVEAHLIVSDAAGLFSAEAIKKAKSILAEVKDKNPREMSLVSFKELPEDKKKAYEKLEKDDKNARSRFFRDWAVDEAKGDKSRGVFVLVCRSPGYIEILADKAIRDKGFTIRDEEQIRDALMSRFREAKEAIEKGKNEEDQTAIRDKGLLAAVELVRDAYKKMAR